MQAFKNQFLNYIAVSLDARIVNVFSCNSVRLHPDFNTHAFRYYIIFFEKEGRPPTPARQVNAHLMIDQLEALRALPKTKNVKTRTARLIIPCKRRFETPNMTRTDKARIATVDSCQLLRSLLYRFLSCLVSQNVFYIVSALQYMSLHFWFLTE